MSIGIALCGAPLMSAAQAGEPIGFAAVRAAHLAPDVPSADAYLEPAHGAAVTAGIAMTYGTVGSYARVPAGVYRVVIVAHGKPASSTPLLSWSARVQSGGAYTLAAEGVGTHHRGVVLPDQLTPPAAGQARIRIIQAASSAGRVSVSVVGGPRLMSSQPIGAVAGYASVPAGAWHMRATGTGAAGNLRTTVRAGAVYSIVVLDVRGGGLTMRPELDASGAARLPGSADTGGGGSATHVIDKPAPASGVGVLALVIVVLGAAGCGALGTARARRRVP